MLFTNSSFTILKSITLKETRICISKPFSILKEHNEPWLLVTAKCVISNMHGKRYDIYLDIWIQIKCVLVCTSYNYLISKIIYALTVNIWCRICRRWINTKVNRCYWLFWKQFIISYLYWHKWIDRNLKHMENYKNSLHMGANHRLTRLPVGYVRHGAVVPQPVSLVALISHS